MYFWRCSAHLFIIGYAWTLTADEERLNTFKATVVEYHPIKNNSWSFEENLNANLYKYLDIISQSEGDIILFPESTLVPFTNTTAFPNVTTEVPEPFTELLCNNSNTKYMNYLKELSCSAITYNKTIVVNTREKENCTLNNSAGFCPESGFVYYNSDIAFNENGFVSAKYRKWNLFGETGLSPPSEVEVVTVTTKNKDTFGIFTCFDILFKSPALVLVKEKGVKNVLFPTMWFSELPFLTALQVQQMWAQENNVTLLSAGANNPSIGSGGTGIFLGEKGPILNEIFGSARIQEFSRNVPPLQPENVTSQINFTALQEDVDRLAKDLDNFTLISDSSLSSHSSILLDIDKTDIVEEVCNGDSVKTCCIFDIKITTEETNLITDKKYVYHLVVFNGVRTFSGVKTAGIECCAVIACLNNSLASCGQRFPNYADIEWPVTFESITVSAIFEQDDNRIQFPNSLLASLRPISPQYTTWKKEDSSEIVKRIHMLNTPQNRLLTFGIYGRDFSRDDTPVVASAIYPSTTMSSTFLLLFALIYGQLLK